MEVPPKFAAGDRVKLLDPASYGGDYGLFSHSVGTITRKRHAVFPGNFHWWRVCFGCLGEK